MRNLKILFLIIPEKLSCMSVVWGLLSCWNYSILCSTEKMEMQHPICLYIDLLHDFMKDIILLCSVTTYVLLQLNQPYWTFCYTLEKGGRTVVLSWTRSFIYCCGMISAMVRALVNNSWFFKHINVCKIHIFFNSVPTWAERLWYRCS